MIIYEKWGWKKGETHMSILNRNILWLVGALLLIFGAFSSAQTNQSIQVNGTGNKHNQLTQNNPFGKRIIIKFKAPTQSIGIANNRLLSFSQQLSVDFQFERLMSGDAEVWSVHGFNRTLYPDLAAVIQQLNQNSAVEYAEIDAMMKAYRVPNDTLYNQQWHYKDTEAGMRLPGAWDVSIGSLAVNVAVLDTGYRPHPDLVANIINEYDMINDLFVANDGNLRDSDAQDPGDWVTANECGGVHDPSDSSWHGTHVAGTVAAVSDNANGVAGVAWNIGLIPVRVLGKCGGYTSDIADGIRWAVGLNVPGVPVNNTFADVINMSLGGFGACSITYQNAIDAAFNAGSTIVVAAGNSNDSSILYQPGNCNNVINVAAGANDGARAYYSNNGANIDITAPGGDGCNPINNNFPSSLADCEGGIWDDTRMVLSTHNNGVTVPGSNNYNWLQGTSMAAPHVAGLAALIKSVNGSLTPAEVEQIIKDSADNFASVPDHQCNTSICGAGYANATAALQNTMVTLGPDLIFSNGFESDIIFKNGFE